MRFGLSSSSEAEDLTTSVRTSVRPPIISSGSTPLQSRATPKGKEKALPPWIKRSNSSRKPRRLTHQPGDSDGDEDNDYRDETLQPGRSLSSRRRSKASIRDSSDYYSDSSAASSSSSSSSSSLDSALTSDSRSDVSDGSYDTSDSEELDWPVAPGRVGRKTRKRTGAAVRSIRLAADEDKWDQEWLESAKSHRGYRVSIARSRRDTDRPTSGQLQSNNDEDFAQVESLLSNLKLQKEETERKDRQQFEAREKKLWESIEEAIRKAEEDARQRAKEEADRLAAARKAQEEADKKAKAAKAEEEKRIKEEQEAKEKEKRDAQDRKQKEEADAQKKQEEEQARERLKGLGGAEALRTQARQEYAKWSEKMKHIKENVLPVVSSNSTWRKQCFQAKRQITPKIGQLTNTKEEVWRITSLISTLLNEAKAAPAPNQEIYLWVLNHLSKCLIRQAEQEVSVKIDTAYPLARLVLWLLLEGHKELGDVLMARLTKKCCWCVGHVPERKADQDEASFAKTIGRSSVEETTVQFTSRISGIIAFYFAICSISPLSPLPPNKPSSSSIDLTLIPAHFRTQALWSWQTRSVVPPMTSYAVMPALWSTLIEVSGDTILRYYGKQGAKIWKLLYNEGILQSKADFVKKEEGKANSGRLQLLLEDVFKNGKCEVPKGREMR
ncbi:unnamed protein product [Sympodiomycopsis kandeliae]